MHPALSLLQRRDKNVQARNASFLCSTPSDAVCGKSSADFQSNLRLNLFNPSLWIYTWNTYRDADKTVSVQMVIVLQPVW